MRIKINNDQTIDELNLTLQILLAWMADHPTIGSLNVARLARINLYVTLVDKNGVEKTVKIEESNEHFQVFNDPPKGGGGNHHKPSRYKKH